MSEGKDERVKMPVLKKATKDIQKAAKEELSFYPNEFQSRVKSRFYRRLEELSHITDKETALQNSKMIEQLAGTDRILKWLEDPAFATWFLDEDYVVDTIASLQQDAIGVVKSVLLDQDAHAGDRLKAARMITELNDMFPGRKQEVRFLDDRLNELSDSETDKEIKRLQSILAAGKDGDK